jgi:hypothetical protein
MSSDKQVSLSNYAKNEHYKRLVLEIVSKKVKNYVGAQ